MTDEPWLKIAALQSAVRYGGSSLKSIPELIVSVCSADPPLWKEFTPPGMDEPVVHKSFDSFITANPPNGLGATVDLIKRVVADDKAAMDEFDKAVQNPVGKHTDVDNINISRADGTSESHALRRLRKEAKENPEVAELREQVLAGNLSAHAAMVQAGFRPRTFTIRADPESAARTIRRQLTPEQVSELARLLND